MDDFPPNSMQSSADREAVGSAAGAGDSGSASAGVPKSTAKKLYSKMRESCLMVSRSGIILPLSQREMFVREIESFSANCSCVYFFALRAAESCSPNFSTAVPLFMC